MYGVHSEISSIPLADPDLPDLTGAEQEGPASSVLLSDQRCPTQGVSGSYSVASYVHVVVIAGTTSSACRPNC